MMNVVEYSLNIVHWVQLTISSVTKSGYNEHTFVRKHLIDINVKKVRIERIALVTGNFLPPANEVVGR